MSASLHLETTVTVKISVWCLLLNLILSGAHNIFVKPEFRLNLSLVNTKIFLIQKKTETLYVELFFWREK